MFAHLRSFSTLTTKQSALSQGYSTMGRSAKFAKKPSKKEKQIKGMVKAASRPAPRPATPPPQDDDAAGGGASKVKKRKMMRAKVDKVGAQKGTACKLMG